MTTKNKIMNYLSDRDWTYVWAIEGMGEEWFASPSVIGRRCRDLRSDGALDSRVIGGKVQYRTRPSMSTLQANQYLDKLTREVRKDIQVSLI